MEVESSLDVSTSSSWSSELIEEFKNTGLANVHQYFCLEIDNLKKRIAILNAIEQNNAREEDSVEESQVGEYVEKSRLRQIDSLAEILRSQKLLDYTPFLAELKLDIVTELRHEIDELENLLIKRKKELIDSKQELESLKEKIKTLDEIAKKRKKEGEMVKEESPEALTRIISHEFQQHKNQMNELLSTLYPAEREDIRNVLKNAVNKYFEDDDDYIDLSADHDYRCLEFLFEADILERHPYEERKIKLARMCD